MTQAITRPIFKISDTIGRKILSFLPKQVSYTVVSKAFAAWNKKAMEKEWQEIVKNPGLEKYVMTIQAEPPLCFKILYERLHKTFCTYSDLDKFKERVIFPPPEFKNPAFAGSYAKECFEEARARTRRAEDNNLSMAWHGDKGGGLYSGLGLTFRFEWEKTPKQIRAYLNAAENQETLNRHPGIDINDQRLNAIPQEVVKFKGSRYLYASHNNIRAFPEEILRMENLQKVDLIENPITVFPEEMYNHCFTLENWLGRPFDQEYDLIQHSDWPFGFFNPPAHTHLDNGYIQFSKKHLKEIPFAMWLREKLRMPNLFQIILGQKMDDWAPGLPCILRWPFIIASALVAIFIVALPTWILNQFLSLCVVPVVTKVRELLGYGRMMRLD